MTNEIRSAREANGNEVVSGSVELFGFDANGEVRVTGSSLAQAIPAFDGDGIFESWSAASAGQFTDGQAAMVLDIDTGTHTDPVTSESVDNAGIYIFRAAAPSGLERVSDTIVAAADDRAVLSQAWAEGTEPGGEGTKSAKEHADDAALEAERAEAAQSAQAAEGATQVALAAGSANAASDFANNASNSASAALSESNFVEGISASAGALKRYRTKALMDADISGIAADEFVEVQADETFSERITRYQKQGPLLVRVATVYPAPTSIYADSVTGNDANLGTRGSPVLTLGRAKALLSDGDTLYLAGNSIFENDDLSDLDDLKIRAYGDGRRPIITASRAIPAADWSLHSGNIYKATVVFEKTKSPQSGVRAGYGLWDDAPGTFKPAAICGLDQIITASALATDTGAMTAGTMTVRETGEDNADPRISFSVASADYYVWLADGSNPGSNGRTIRYAEQIFVLLVGLNADIEGIDCARTENKDAVGSAANGNIAGRVHDFRMIDANSHGTVLRGTRHSKYFASSNPKTLNFGASGNGLHLFRTSLGDGASDGAYADDCELIGFFSGVSVHGGTGDTVAPYSEWDLGEIKVSKCNRGISVGGGLGVPSDGIRIRKLVCDETTMAVATGGADVRVGRLEYSYRSVDSADCQVFDASSDGTIIVENGFAVLSEGVGFARRYLSGSQSVGSITLDNFTAVGAQRAGGGFQFGNLTVTDCIGIPVPTDTYTGTFTATNSHIIDVQFRTLGALQAEHSGIGNDCTVAVHEQPYLRTIIADDVDEIDLGNVASGTSGNNWFTVPWGFSALQNSGPIKIVDYDGAGNDLVLYEIERDSANSASGVRWAYSLRDSETLDATFSNKQIKSFRLNRKTFPADAGTAQLDPDRDVITLSNPEYFSVGQYIRLGALLGRDAFGLFRITAMTDDHATLDREVPWMTYTRSGGASYVSHAGGIGATPPSVPVSFGFPLLMGVQVPTSLEGTLTYADSTEITFTQNNQFTRMDPISAAATTFDGTNGVNNSFTVETGEILSGFAVDVGGEINLTWPVYVRELEPQYVADPLRSTYPILKKDTVIASKRIGFSPNLAAKW